MNKTQQTHLNILLDIIKDKYLHPTKTSFLLCQTYLYNILAYLSRQYELSSSLKEDPISKFLQTLTFIQQHYCEPLSLEDLAKNAGFSKRHYIRIFKDVQGITPYVYIKNLRLKKSYLLLNTTNLTLESISTSCGFYDAAHFSKAFKTYYGFPPSTLRKG